MLADWGPWVFTMAIVVGLGLVAFQFMIIIQQGVRINRLKRALLAWREDTLRAGKKLQRSGRQFPEIESDLQHTLNMIDDVLRDRR